MAKKSADAFRTISEVSDALDTPAHVLRFWESKFSQIKPVKRAGGRRYYRPDDIDLLNGIRTLLHEQGMTIKGAQKLLREKGVKHVAAIAPISGAPQSGAAASPARQPAKKKVAKVDEPKTASFEFESAADTNVDLSSLPEVIIGDAPANPSVLSLIAKTSAADLQAKSNDLAPIIAKLEALHERMRAS